MVQRIGKTSQIVLLKPALAQFGERNAKFCVDGDTNGRR
jgi:hypothetical protein